MPLAWSIVLGRRGFSLSEMMVGIAVTSIGLVVLASVMYMGWTQFYNLKNRIEAEHAVGLAEYLFRSYFAQAVDIQGTDLVANNYSMDYGAAQPGRIRGDFLYDEMADMAGDWATLATFVREVGGRGVINANGHGTLLPATIWYRKPTPTTGGIIVFDNGSALPMVPQYSDQFVDRVTLLEFSNKMSAVAAPATAEQRARSVQVRLRIRHHWHSNGQLSWCPALDIQNNVAGCATTAPYRDLEKTFVIVFRNNLLHASGVLGYNVRVDEERQMGALYFFKPVTPVGSF